MAPTDAASEQAALQADKNAAAADEAVQLAAGETTTAAAEAAQIIRDQMVAGDQSEGTLT